jgi:hypothetical protein
MAGSAFDWTGFYVGAHAGVSTASSVWSATQPGGAPSLTGSLNLFSPFDLFTEAGSHFGGFTAGYNYVLPSRIVLGGEADVSFASTLSAGQSFASPLIGAANYSDTVELFGTVRGRVGYDVNHWLLYATGGLAWTYDQFQSHHDQSRPYRQPAGGGSLRRSNRLDCWRRCRGADRARLECEGRISLRPVRQYGHHLSVKRPELCIESRHAGGPARPELPARRRSELKWRAIRHLSA